MQTVWQASPRDGRRRGPNGIARAGRLDPFTETNGPPQMFKDDGVEIKDVERVLDAFPNQSLDFYGAIRSATYDKKVKAWVETVCGGKVEDPVRRPNAWPACCAVQL